MSDLKKVTGSACLEYIDNDIGLIAHDNVGVNVQTAVNQGDLQTNLISSVRSLTIFSQYSFSLPVTIWKCPHDKTKRIIGLVLDKYDDGGLYVAILGNEVLGNGHVKIHAHKMFASVSAQFERDLVTLDIKRKSGYNGYPDVTPAGTYVTNGAFGSVRTMADSFYSFDDLLDFTPEFSDYDYSSPNNRPLVEMSGGGFHVTGDKTHTFKFGKGVTCNIQVPGEYCDNPVRYLSGDLYFAIIDLCNKLGATIPQHFNNEVLFDIWEINFGDIKESVNQVALPFNLMLTNNENYAQSYLQNGTIPPDAFLYPLDWENLPSYTDDQDPEDPDDTNEPGDNGRDIDPNLPVVPTFTPSMLSNYNWYWLDVSQYSSFLNWFWNDIGDYNDFDDLINKVKGLYNDVASAVLMCRFFPVELSWIGGEGTASNIKVGMIEKSGAVTTINTALDSSDGKSPMKVRDIGHIRVPRKYKSFCDLAPYTQLSIYLPFYGFMDLDIDLFMGHDIYVKGLYDYLTGTIQYFIYYDNEMLVNTVVAKMAVDIPITLQTKNDRDSAVFQNVSSVVGGLIGAGAGIASGNPIGMALGVTQGVGAINSGNASAPLNVKGTVGETGAFYAPPKCYMILRRPTIQPSDSSKSTGLGLTTWAKNVGQLCGYGYKLENLNGEGFTVCHTPRIVFKKTTPLQSEIDEIYDYLEKGVIL